MRFSKQPLTSTDRRAIAQKQKNKAIKKRKRLDRKHQNDPFKDFDQDYQDKRKSLNQTIAQAIADEKFEEKLALAEAENPKRVPKYVDTSRRTFFAPEITIASNNKATAEGKIEGNLRLYKGQKKAATAPSEGKKTSKVKTILIVIAIVLAAAGLIALTVHIHSCILNSKDSSLGTYSVQTI